MPVSFPTTKRYFVSFRNGDVGLTPSYPIFTYYKNANTLANITPQPTFTELSNGTYYFTVPFALATDPDIIFQIDGGPSIPTEEIRYQTSMASPKDLFIDEPISQVKDDVWDDTTNRAPGTKGDFVEHIGVDGDAVDAATVFGKLYKARDAIMGGTGFGGTGENIFTARDRIMGGTGFGGTGVDVKSTYDRIGAPVAASISADIANVQSTANTVDSKIGTPVGTVSSDIAGVQTKLGSPVLGATIALDIEAVNTTVGSVNTNVGNVQTTANAINTKIGSPAVSVSADIAAVKAETAAIKAKTDNLPSDPASQTTTNTSITNATTTIMGLGGPTLLQLGGATFNTSTDSLEAISTAVTAMVPPDNASISSILTQVNKIGAVGDASGASSVFGKIYEAKDSIKGGVPGVDLTQIAGAGFSSGSMSLKATHDTLLRVTGMLHENSVLDGCAFDSNNNLTSGRLRLYTTSADAVAAQAIPFPGIYDTNKIAEYTITATYTGSNLTTYLVTKV